jgi:molybdopterin synthase sulfur carrier subunit
VIRVFVPTQLQSYCAGASHVEATGATVDLVLRDLDRRFPGIRFRVVDEQDRIRRHMRIFMSRDPVTDIHVELSKDAELLIFGALSGG